MPGDGLAQTLRRLALEKLYLTLPRLECQKVCQRSCGIILFKGEERSRIETRIKGSIPTYNTWSCPLLTIDGDCSVYDIRPMICRLWGLTQDMACPFGCVPERWLTTQEAHALVAQAEGE